MSGHENWCSFPVEKCTCNARGVDPFEDEAEDEKSSDGKKTNPLQIMATQVRRLEDQLAETKATIKHLRGKSEFNMPAEMHGRFHNGQCTDACDMVDGPCACGASHNVKEWLGKLNKLLDAEKTAHKITRKGVLAEASLLDDAANKLKEITGEQNIWKAIDQLATLQAENCWVAIEKRLPKKTKEDLRPQVLVFDGESISVALWRHYDFGWGFETDRGEPTHWKPVGSPQRRNEDEI